MSAPELILHFWVLAEYLLRRDTLYKSRQKLSVELFWLETIISRGSQ